MALVVRIPAGLGAHDRDAHLGEQLPVGVELPGGRVEELEPGEVGVRPPSPISGE